MIRHQKHASLRPKKPGWWLKDSFFAPLGTIFHKVSLTSSENNKKTVTKRTIIMRIVTNASKFSPKSSRCASDIYRSKPSAACSSLLPSCLATILSAIEMVVNSEAALRCALRRVDNHLHGRYPLNKQPANRKSRLTWKNFENYIQVEN